MEDIDSMDICYFMRVLAYRANGDRLIRKDERGRAFIDDVWPI